MRRVLPPSLSSRAIRRARIAVSSFVLAAVLGVGPAGLSSPRTARADGFDEREQQLKALGIDDALRPRIHRAIDSGARALARTLSTGFRPGPKASPPNPVVPCGPGPSVLATLALAHARTPESIEAAKGWVQKLLVADAASAAEIQSDTYMAGITGLLAADPACEVPPSVSRELALRLTAAQRERGWWDYWIAPDGLGKTAQARGAPPPLKRDGPPNLSTTQFAVLGIFGLKRAGAPVPIEVWERHARGICHLQTQDGSWPYVVAHPSAGYTNGTYMGVASVVVAEDMLRDRLRDPALMNDLAAARSRGLAALRREVREFMRNAKSWTAKAAKISRSGFAFQVPVDGYGMYALEKACIFAGVEKIDEQSWYEAGARLLVAAQGDDGMWNDVNTTSFALLFLSRSPDRCKPKVVTDTETAPVTTKTEPPAKPAPPTTTGR